MKTVRALAGGALLLFIGAVVACSSDDPAPPAGTSDVPEGGAVDATETPEGGAVVPGEAKRGSRLAPLYRETADGFSQFYGMADTLFANERCFVSTSSDGASRCLPVESLYVTDELYAAGCTTRVTDGPAGCAKRQFVTMTVSGATSCETTNAIHDTGAVHSGPIFRKEEGGGCVEATPAEGRTYYVVGAERPPTDFVKFTRATDVIAGGIGILALDGGDGSHFPYPTLMDVGRAAACEPQLAADGVKRCLPAGAAVVYNFTDSLCTKPAAHEIAESCDPIYEAKLARMPDPANLDRAKIYTLDAKRPDLQVYARIDPMTCDGPMMAPSEAVFDIGAEVPAAMFSAIDNEDQGGTRIVSSRPVAAGKRFPKWGPLFDKQLDALCSPSRSSDGKLRCAPQAGLIAYSDDQCSQRIFVRVGGDVPKYALEIGKDCAQTSHLFPVAAEITPAPAMTYQDFTGSCVGEVISDQAEVYSVGAEVDPSTFVEVTEVIR